MPTNSSNVLHSNQPRGGMSTLLFWQGRGAKGNGGAAPGATGNGPAGRAWLHAPDLLLKGHVAYLVKFLGTTAVDQPKGIEVVKEAIRRIQFTQQLKKSETNVKPKKVEITISVDGVAIQEPRTNNILHQFPLHRISYCADDKGAKKFFSFISKSDASDGGDTHECFVFISNKLAAEITLTIGQAFDLAYRRFVGERGNAPNHHSSGGSNTLVAEYEARLKELAALLGSVAPDQLSAWLSRKGIKGPADWTPPPPHVDANTPPNSPPDASLVPLTPPLYVSNNHRIPDLMNDSIEISPSAKNPSVGTKLEGLLLNSDSDSDFDPRAAESDPPAVTLNQNRPRVSQQMPLPQNGTTPPPLLAPPPKASKRQAVPTVNGNGSHNGDPFGSAPFAAPNNVVNLNYANSASSKPNYNLSDFNSVFPPPLPPPAETNGIFSNGTSGLVGYDPFDTAKFDNFNGVTNGFSNPMGNGFNNGNTNGFGHTSPFGDKQNNTAILDSNFSGFLDKRISEMKDGFSRGLVIGNEDFSVDTWDPLKKN